MGLISAVFVLCVHLSVCLPVCLHACGQAGRGCCVIALGCSRQPNEMFDFHVRLPAPLNARLLALWYSKQTRTHPHVCNYTNTALTSRHLQHTLLISFTQAYTQRTGPKYNLALTFRPIASKSLLKVDETDLSTRERPEILFGFTPWQSDILCVITCRPRGWPTRETRYFPLSSITYTHRWLSGSQTCRLSISVIWW